MLGGGAMAPFPPTDYLPVINCILSHHHRENSRLYFIFEYVRADLLGLMREKPNESFSEFWIRSVVQQVLQARPL